jgi:hypothetical protein
VVEKQAEKLRKLSTADAMGLICENDGFSKLLIDRLIK